MTDKVIRRRKIAVSLDYEGDELPQDLQEDAQKALDAFCKQVQDQVLDREEITVEGEWDQTRNTFTSFKVQQYIHSVEDPGALDPFAP